MPRAEVAPCLVPEGLFRGADFNVGHDAAGFFAVGKRLFTRWWSEAGYQRWVTAKLCKTDRYDGVAAEQTFVDAGFLTGDHNTALPGASFQPLCTPEFQWRGARTCVALSSLSH